GLIAEWILAASAGRTKAIVAIPVSLAFLLMVSSFRLRGESVRDLGLRVDNFVQAMKLLLLPMIVVSILSLLIGWVFGGRPDFFRWHTERYLVAQLSLGFAWGFVQQYVLQGFLNRRLQIILGPGIQSILITATIFSGLHFPNPWLMVMTFIG